MDKRRLKEIESKLIVDEMPHPQDVEAVEGLIKDSTKGGQHPPLREIHEKYGYDKQTILQACKDLVNEGWLEEVEVGGDEDE